MLNGVAEVRDFGAYPEDLTHQQVVENLRAADPMLLVNGAHATDISGEALGDSFGG